MFSNPLIVENLTKKFYPKNFFGFKQNKKVFNAVNNISFELKQGEILGFLGPNGAGKTTTIQMLLSVLKPTSGSIKFFDKDLSKNRQILQHISYASGYMKLPSSLTVKQSLYMQGMLYSLKFSELKEKAEQYLQIFNIKHLENKECTSLSAGQTTSALLAKTFMVNPKIVLLDEPTAALDPVSAKNAREFILKENKKNGTSILITSHNMTEVAELCDRILVLRNGEIIANNTPEILAATISIARVQLMVGDGLKRTENYALEQNLKYKIEGRHIEIEIDEHKISQLLTALAQLKIIYTQISIDKPTLEDYFLSLVKKQAN
ncbi:TPA: ABC transporter ATP-binding protein [Candidatus Dependentiae bacterium]|nr:MAG: ABC-type transport system, ATP-binding component [candidate division TM6 bacterium GW2011_GWE2_31_21]KKP53142.1 MAG: ABC-type transport system, ATP-binding component [candidate division TM6 bacterium GW2011_GWF2_33_332]HBS47961.1 ABC transporter ATP-binding protein [Candidatus Dependentiae bacterium]HBZ73435.1 ABC transporter ATP-binding protein [Candidatus Dependentiae bacterium]